MKNNKGFISVTVIYAFFLVFLTLMIYIVTNMTVNRNLLNNMKKAVKNDLNDASFARYLINRYDEDNINFIKLNSNDYTYGIDDNSYRFTGSDPDNYVKFDENSEKVYRIIGIFKEKVKLIEETNLDTNWVINFGIGSNDYDGSYIYRKLNTEADGYLASIDNISKFIEFEDWYVGGIDEEIIAKSGKEIAEAEVGKNKNTGVIVNDRIGLPYISDYIYAQDSSNKATYGKNVTNTNNWMFVGDSWFITRNTSVSKTEVYYLNSNGNVSSIASDATTIIARPTFYLKNNIKLLSGEGTYLDPYIIGE
mgnify:FL=1